MENQTLVTQICTTNTQQLISKGALLVDVREPDEVAQLSFEVPNIINIPLSEFEERYQEIPGDIDVVMVCKSGNRSLRAAGFLVNHGYHNVVNMEKGMDRWLVKGFPTKGSITDTKGNDCCCSSSDCC